MHINFLATSSYTEDNTESTDKSVNTKSTTESAEGTESTTESTEGTESTTKAGVSTAPTTKITDTKSTTKPVSATVGAQKNDEPVGTGIVVVIALVIGVTMTIIGFVAYK